MDTLHKESGKRTKLTIRIAKRFFDRFSERVEASFVRRDAFLAHVVKSELERLRDDLPTPNSSAARAYIEHHLRQLFLAGYQQISLPVDPDTASRIHDVCLETNVPREAFVNRLVFLLIADSGLLGRQLFGLEDDDAHELREEVKADYMMNLELEMGFAPLPMVAEILAEPFERYRLMLEAQGEKRTLHGVEFTQSALTGFNCYLPDSSVPGTEAYELAQRDARRILESLKSTPKKVQK